MIVGYSLSPGGLLLPYHLGALASLEYHGFLKDSNPIAGASAGSIAAASYACGIKMDRILDATIDLSNRCRQQGGARGRLLPLLKQKLDQYIGDEEFERLQHRDGGVAISYFEVFPFFRPLHQTSFSDRKDLMNAVCHSSMFPMFTSNMPLSVDLSRHGPRVLVDGVFSEPFNRFGCPDFKNAGIHVDETVQISVLPQELVNIGLSKKNSISPSVESAGKLVRLALGAVESSSAREMSRVYESGWIDAESWCANSGRWALEAADASGPQSVSLN